MSSFATRVELHKGTSDDYDRLHSAMEDQGFSRTITSDDDKTYRLPTAEYNYEGDAKIEDVIAFAKKAAKSTQLSFAVIVTESKARMWSGLDLLD